MRPLQPAIDLVASSSKKWGRDEDLPDQLFYFLSIPGRDGGWGDLWPALLARQLWRSGQL